MLNRLEIINITNQCKKQYDKFANRNNLDKDRIKDITNSIYERELVKVKYLERDVQLKVSDLLNIDTIRKSILYCLYCVYFISSDLDQDNKNQEKREKFIDKFKGAIKQLKGRSYLTYLLKSID